MNFSVKGQKGLYARSFNSRRPISPIFTTLLLATRTLSAIYAFFDKHPDVFVYATGSTSARTRLYRMGIARFYDEMVQDFDLYGQIGDEFYEFEIGKDYSGFLAQRKFD